VIERPRIAVAAAVEGLLDEGVASRVIIAAGGLIGPTYGNRRGIDWVLHHLGGYNHGARFGPWLVLVDLDTDDCAPKLRETALPRPSEFMCFRVAVRAAEVWLMADKERLAEYLSVAPGHIPDDPESLPDPKAEMLRVASRSRKRDIVSSMVSAPGRPSRTGPAYTGTLLSYVLDVERGWRPEIAATRSDSLARCLNRLSECLDAYAASIDAA
jgi:hypothetical protein